MDNQEQFLTADLRDIIVFKATFGLFVTVAENFGDLIFRLVAELVTVDVGVKILVLHRLLFEDIKDGNDHATCADLRLNYLCGAEEEILEHLDLTLKERIVVGIAGCILCSLEAGATEVGNVLDLAAILVEEIGQ